MFNRKSTVAGLIVSVSATLLTGSVHAAFIDDFNSGDPTTLIAGGPQVWQATTKGGASTVNESGGTLQLTADGAGTINNPYGSLVTIDSLPDANFFTASKDIALTGWRMSYSAGNVAGVQSIFSIESSAANQYGNIVNGLTLRWWYNNGTYTLSVLSGHNSQQPLATITSLVDPNDPGHTAGVPYTSILNVNIHLDATQYMVTVTDQNGYTASVNGAHGLTQTQFSATNGNPYLMLSSFVGGRSDIYSTLTLDRLSVVPEPMALSFLAVGGLFLMRRRK